MMGKHWSPGKLRARAKRAERRANDPKVQARAKAHEARMARIKANSERVERANVDADKLAELRKIAEAIHNGA